jgi:hypothetical protein
VKAVVSARERRTLVRGISLLALGLLVARGLPEARRWEAAARASAARRMAEAARLEAAIAALPATRDSAAARRSRLVALAPRVLEGSSTASAGASLAAMIAGAAARAEVQLGSLEVQYDSAAAGPFALVRVRADASGPLSGILRMLAILEGGPELVRIPEWSITQPVVGGAMDQPEQLRLELVAEGISAPERGT